MGFDPKPAAAVLAQAWRSGVQLAELPLAIRPRSIDEGYAVQDALIDAMAEPTAGWKLGVGSPAAMRQTGLGRPLVGRVLGSCCHPSGASFALARGTAVTVEFEIAFVLARDVEPIAPIGAPLDVVAEARIAFEIVRSRYLDRRAVGWPSFAADSVGFAALVVGRPIDIARIARVTEEVVVKLDGDEAARGLQGDDWSDPIAGLAALLVHARERGVTLRRGEIVSAGAIARPFTVERDARLSATACGVELHTHLMLTETPSR